MQDIFYIINSSDWQKKKKKKGKTFYEPEKAKGSNFFLSNNHIGFTGRTHFFLDTA